VYFTFANTNKWLKVGDIVKVYRRLDDTPYTEQEGLATTIAAGDVDRTSFTVIDTPPDSEYYYYKVVVERDGKDLKDDTTVTTSAYRSNEYISNLNLNDYSYYANISLSGWYLGTTATVRIYRDSSRNYQVGGDHAVNVSSYINLDESWFSYGSAVTYYATIEINGVVHNVDGNVYR
jgi:hypothetical protein